jgi:hypothetical protein
MNRFLIKDGTARLIVQEVGIDYEIEIAYIDAHTHETQSFFLTPKEMQALKEWINKCV